MGQAEQQAPHSDIQYPIQIHQRRSHPLHFGDETPPDDAEVLGIRGFC
jgi:hypothetical protein